MNIRNSNTKKSKKTGFRYRMKTKSGRNIIKAHRRIGRQLTPKG